MKGNNYKGAAKAGSTDRTRHKMEGSSEVGVMLSGGYKAVASRDIQLKITFDFGSLAPLPILNAGK